MLVVAAAAVLLGWLTAPRISTQRPAQRTPMGLFTSLPIWWDEADGMAAQIAGPRPPHWARAVLEARHRVILLDTLLDPGLTPPGGSDLLIAQPRPLTPQENVALDSWVRRGGHVLLFADPRLTWDSRFALGDRRRPQDTVLLATILNHWGLDLRFDPDQPGGMREIAGGHFPVNLAGTLAAVSGGTATCRTGQAGLIAQCRIGAGRALIVADSALLEPAGNPVPRARGLRALMERAFAR